MLSEATAVLPSLKEPTYKKSGDLFNEKKGRSTLALSQEFSYMQVDGVYSEIDRKLWLVLIYLAFDKLHISTQFVTNLRDIAKVFRECGGADDGTDWLFDSARRLRKSGVDWIDQKEGKINKTTSTLLSGLKENLETGEIAYNLDPFLVEKLLDNKEFARLRIRFTLRLSGKYTIPLYMILEPLCGRNHPHLKLTIEELRQRLNVPEGKLIDWKNFKNRVLEPALDRINEGCEEGGVIASYRTESKGRKIENIVFTAIKTPERLKDEENHSRKIGKQQANKTNAEIRPFTGEEYENFKLIARGLDIYAYEQDWRKWCAQKDIKPETPRGHFIAFLMRKAKPNKDMLNKTRSQHQEKLWE